MDRLHDRLDALEAQVHTLTQHTHTVTRRLRWWRGLASGAVVLAVLTWALPAVIAQEEEAKKGEKGLAQRVEALEKLLRHFSRKDNEIFITGANLHIVNGLGQTDCGPEDNPIPDCPNGLGNLIVGYNELRPVPDGEDPNVRTGSPNVVVGQQHNFSRFGGLVVGNLNTISGDFAVVSGGTENTASGGSASVSGGNGNLASGDASSISGGEVNTASSVLSSISGGASNMANGQASSISGGAGNTTSNNVASVSGGLLNTASGEASSVSGGRSNTASGNWSSVSGGGGIDEGNTASGTFAVVSGGQNITQETDFGWAAGSEADEVVVGNFRSP